MKSSFLIPCLALFLMNINSGLSRMKARTKSSSSRKSGSNIPKTNTGLKTGLLLYKGSRLAIQFNKTEESEVYASDYAMFPDELYYPRSSQVTDYEEFLSSCINTTLELDANKEKISKLPSDVYTRMTLNIIEFLCTENYNREYSNAGQCSRELWVVTIVMLLVINALN